MHSTSFLGVLFGRALHAADEIAPALAGTSSEAAKQSGASHADAAKRELKGRLIEPSPGDLDSERARTHERSAVDGILRTDDEKASLAFAAITRRSIAKGMRPLMGG